MNADPGEATGHLARPELDESAKPNPLVQSTAADVLLGEIVGLGVTDVITVPDTHQKTLLEALALSPDLALRTVATEDEAISINAGLWIGGRQPIVLIQNVGVFACMNALRGIAVEMRIPTLLLVGQFGRDPLRAVQDNASLTVRTTPALLEVLSIPVYDLDGPEDVGKISEGFRRSRDERRPVAVLINARTK